ncbi:hypothetical protein SDC9_202074 [bioreactor metagenome]|uniref:Uncharacterized protein n=1 Tax=bioreactor metagenome TaxID=1076179 RepID=A0A645J1M8_9ZZZZ
MEIDHGVVIHFIYMVARKHQQVFGLVTVDKVNVLVYGVRGPGVPFAPLVFHIGRQYERASRNIVQVPGRPRSDIRVEFQRLVLGQHPHCVQSGMDAVGKRKINDLIFAAVRYRGLGPVFGQNAQAASLPAGQYHRYAFFSDKHLTLPLFFL